MPSPKVIYKKILLLYPEYYRKKYGMQIVYTMEDMLADEPRVIRRWGIWMREIILLPGNVLEQHILVIAQRGGLSPGILLGLTSFALLAPFFVAMLLDEISERFYNQHLYSSWLWSGPVLMVWVIVLPLLSLFVSLIAYLLLVLRASMKAGKVSLQLKKLWLLTLAGLASLTVLCIVAFHDSFGCWHGNPTNVVICTERIFLSSDKT